MVEVVLDSFIFNIEAYLMHHTSYLACATVSLFGMKISGSSQWTTEPGKYRAYRAEPARYYYQAEPSNTEPSLTEYLR